MTRSKLLAFMMNGDRKLEERDLHGCFGSQWEEPMRGLVELRLVIPYLEHGRQMFAIAQG